MADNSSTSHNSNSSTLHSSDSHSSDSSRDSGLIRPLPRVQHKIDSSSRVRVTTQWNTPWCPSRSIVLISNFGFSLVLFRILRISGLFCGTRKENPRATVRKRFVGALMTSRSPFLSSMMKRKNGYKEWLSGFSLFVCPILTFTRIF